MESSIKLGYILSTDGDQIPFCQVSIESKYSLMKIWILSSNRWNSAITEYALSMARSLSEGGHEVLFLPLKDSPADTRAARLGLKTFPLSSFELRLGTLFDLRSLALKESPSLILTCGGKEQTLSLFLPKTKKVRFRGERFRSFSILRKLIHRLSHYQVAGLISPCNVLSEELKRFTEKPIFTVPIGLDTSYWRPHARPTLQGAARPFCLIFGRFDPIKGHREFFGLWKLVLERYSSLFPESPKPLLKIFGRKENLTRDDLEAAALKLGIESDTEIVEGSVERPSELLSSAALGIVPSLGSEVICRVAQEFLLCGTPVLLSKAGALEEVLFESAGICSDLKEEDVDKIVLFLRSVFTEDDSVREKRSMIAQQKFNFLEMRSRLEILCDEDSKKFKKEI
jgi:glycosyltransferase involved in cell wall biosynthesis